MLDVHLPHRATSELIDPTALIADLKELAERHAGRDRDLRSAIAQRLKAAMTQARTRAENLLLDDRHGRRCAERLAVMQDEIIRILFEFAGSELYPSRVPSEAERMAGVATGGFVAGPCAAGPRIQPPCLSPRTPH